MNLAWSFYTSTVLVYLGVDVMACWGLNLQYGYTGIVNFSFIIYQSAGAYDVVLVGCDGTTSRTAALRVTVAPAGTTTLPPLEEIRRP